MPQQTSQVYLKLCAVGDILSYQCGLSHRIDPGGCRVSAAFADDIEQKSANLARRMA